MKLFLRSTLGISWLLAVTFLLFSCGGSNKKESSAEDVSFSEVEQRLSSEIDKVLHDLPPPSEVPYILQAAAADYSPKLINGLGKVESYQTDQDKAALNLGIYATDIGYLASYEKVQETMDYLEACQKLGESLGISSVFNVALAEKFEANMSNPDSLAVLMNQAVEQAEMNLQASDRLTVAALILSGSFIEGLYLAVRVVETYPKDELDEDTRNLLLERLVQTVLDQEKPLRDVIAMLKDIPHDDTILKIITELNILLKLYEGDLAEVEKKISENTGDFVLTPDILRDITIEVKRIRGEIVE